MVRTRKMVDAPAFERRHSHKFDFRVYHKSLKNATQAQPLELSVVIDTRELPSAWKTQHDRWLCGWHYCPTEVCGNATICVIVMPMFADIPRKLLTLSPFARFLPGLFSSISNNFFSNNTKPPYAEPLPSQG